MKPINIFQHKFWKINNAGIHLLCNVSVVFRIRMNNKKLGIGLWNSRSPFPKFSKIKETICSNTYRIYRNGMGVEVFLHFRFFHTASQDTMSWGYTFFYNILHSINFQQIAHEPIRKDSLLLICNVQNVPSGICWVPSCRYSYNSYRSTAKW